MLCSPKEAPTPGLSKLAHCLANQVREMIPVKGPLCVGDKKPVWPVISQPLQFLPRLREKGVFDNVTFETPVIENASSQVACAHSRSTCTMAPLLPKLPTHTVEPGCNLTPGAPWCDSSGVTVGKLSPSEPPRPSLHGNKQSRPCYSPG